MASNALPTSLPVLGGSHELTLRALALEPDSFAIRYFLTPALPETPDGTSPILLALEAEDDLGNEYTDWGGAFGSAPDGSYTSGTIAGQPGVPAEARGLRLRITFLRNAEEFPYELTLPVAYDA
ncbi:hypothetical protein [Streptomyces sp. CBMA152]|uniref:hypothetical protein n=1 Tax=Streptomyces sp. CBMA152 TaxID=1896312 RepID=UPI001661454E|nr:hypothetical protein [Streptomyces sp. CBMA152]MBD0744204.1 hypothetical protein [Streptomyces sp. CBMA152]